MITMMISKDADFDHKDEEGGECRVQTKVKYVAGFGQNHKNRVDLGWNMRKGKEGVVIWAKQAQAAFDSRPGKQPKHRNFDQSAEDEG